jgi:uncharacterized membrane protein
MSDPNVPPPPSYTPPPPSYTPPPPPPPMGTPPGAASPNRSIMIVLSYLWLLALIPLLVEKNDPEVQWHAKNGLVLTAAEVIVWIAATIFSMLTVFIHLGCAGCFLHSAIFVVFLVLRIMGIVKGVGGQRFIIPGLSQYADRF